jgi:hypothetical protein
MTMRTFLGKLLIGLMIVTDFIAEKLTDVTSFLDDAAEGMRDSLRDLGYEITEMPYDD